MNKSGKTVIRRMLAKLLDEKMGAYSAAAAAALLAGGTSAQAAVQGTVLDDPVTLAGPSSEYEIDFNGDGTPDVGIMMATSTTSSDPISAWWTSNIVSATVGNFLAGPAGAALPVAMNAGAPVAGQIWQAAPGLLARWDWYGTGPGGTVFDTTSLDKTGNFLGHSDKFLGIKFEVGPDTHYGWVQVGTAADASEATITGYGWNDVPDGQIAAGEVPEPSSLCLLALGAAGMAARRRKKRPE